LKRIPVPQIDEHIDKITQACKTNSLANVEPPLTEYLRTIGTVVGKVVETANVIQRDQLLYREESDMLWWMSGKHSRDFKVPMAQMQLAEACIVAGKELADLTKVTPGPFAAQAILHTMLQRENSDPNETVALSTAINKTDREWRQAWAESFSDSEGVDLCPILFGVQRSLESQGDSDWHPVFKTVTGLGPSLKVLPTELAVQVYEESLFVRAFDQAVGEA
jgi:hypothetical protein